MTKISSSTINVKTQNGSQLITEYYAFTTCFDLVIFLREKFGSQLLAKISLSPNKYGKLQTNHAKTEVLRLTSQFVKSHSLGPQFMIVGVPVDITSQTGNLGVIMATNFTLSTHINDLCKKGFLHH